MSKWLKRNMEGYLFILPWLIGVLLLALGPMAASLGLSLTKYEILTPPRYIGMANYQRIWNDELFWVSLWNTVYYVVVCVPLRLLLALFFAAAQSAAQGHEVFQNDFLSSLRDRGRSGVVALVLDF